MPVIVAVVVADTETVLIGKVADLAPDAIFIKAGTVALLLLELKPIGSPPFGAALLSVMVPVADAPPSTTVGETANWLRVALTISQTIPQLAPFTPPW